MSDKENLHENPGMNKEIVTMFYIIEKDRLHLTRRRLHLFNKKETLERFEDLLLISQIIS